MGRRDSAGAMRRDAAEGGKRCGERARAGGWRGAWGAAGPAGGGEPEGRERKGGKWSRAPGSRCRAPREPAAEQSPGRRGASPEKLQGL